MQLFKYYILLNEDKSPKSNERGGWLKISREQMLTEANVGGVLADDIILVDYDDMHSAECFLKLAKSLNLKTLAIKTDRGIHFYFKHEKKDNLKSISHYINCLGLEGDLKVGNKNCYALIKRKGKMRQTLYGSVEDLEEIPFYLTPIKHLTGDEKSPVLGLREGDGRNSTLSSFKLVLNGRGYNSEQIKTCLSLINRFVFTDPLSDRELETVSRDESSSEIFKENFGKYKTQNLTTEEKQEKREKILEKARETKKQLEDEKREWFNLFAKEIAEKYHFVQIEGVKKNLLYYYIDNHYELIVNEDLLNNIFLKEAEDKGKLISQGEIANYIIPYFKKATPIYSQRQIEEDRNLYLATNNKLIIYTKDRQIKIEEPTPYYFCTSKINVDYNEKAAPCEIDKFLKEISNNKEDTETLLKELVGYCLFPKNIFRKAFFLIGNGGNGKSTFLNLLTCLLGYENTTNISLFDIENNRFATANLKDKLANLGDDISSDDFTKLSNFKIITSGDTLSAEFKGAQAFSFKPYCKLIYSCNIAPIMYETSDGIKSRVVYIPFEKKFINDGKIKELDYLSKINDKQNLSRLLTIGLEALKNLLQRGQFTETKAGKKKAEELLREGDPVYSFALDYETQGKVYDGVKVRDLYKMYLTYLKEYFPKFRIFTINTFSRKLRNLYDGLTTTKRKIGNLVFTVFEETKELIPLNDTLTLDSVEEEIKEEETEEELSAEIDLFLKDFLQERNLGELTVDEIGTIVSKISLYIKLKLDKDKIKEMLIKSLKKLGAVNGTSPDNLEIWVLPWSVVYDKYKRQAEKTTPPHLDPK